MIVDCLTNEDEALAAAIDAIRAGELVVLPTDTVYGVGADAFSRKRWTSYLPRRGEGAISRRLFSSRALRTPRSSPSPSRRWRAPS